MLTQRIIKLIILFCGVLITGLILGNLIVIIISLLPLCLLLTAISVNPPGQINLDTHQYIARAWVGDCIEVKYEITSKRGLGLFSVFQEIPPHFSLVEGNNFRVFWKGWKTQKFIFGYKICCTKRGLYKILRPEWEANHPLYLKSSTSGTLGETFI